MEENSFWSGLGAEIPEFLAPDYDDEGVQFSRQDDVVLLRDVRTGGRVVFTVNGNSVEVFVDLPSDAAEKPRLMAVIGSEMSGRTWRTGWRQGANLDYRQQVSESVLRVMRDGLGIDPSGLRYSAWGDGGPDQWGLCRSVVVPARPTDRGAPETCSGWEDFGERLEWVLTTLPMRAPMVLVVRSGGQAVGFLQFYRYFQHYRLSRAVIHASSGIYSAAAVESLKRAMAQLGWVSTDQTGGPQPAPPVADGDQVWVGPPVWDNAFGVREDAVPWIVDTFRDALGVADPGELRLECTTLQTSYIGAELGVVDHRQRVASEVLTREQCQSWDNFIDRLDCVLAALPVGGLIHLMADLRTDAACVSQWVERRSGTSTYEYGASQYGLTSEESTGLAGGLIESGCHPVDGGSGYWQDSSSDTRALSERVVWILREVLAVAGPADLRYQAFQDDPENELPQIYRDLGVN
ncbi:TY-Chap domain-containing protein [Nocardia sp. NPDC055321]